MLAAVPKDGSPYEDMFELKTDRPVSYWDQIYTLFGALKVEVAAFRSEGRIVAVISLRTKAGAPCARCLEPAVFDVYGEQKYIFSTCRERERSDAGESDGDEEMILLDSWEDEIDLAGMIWETLITSLPAAPLCSPDCKGLCPQCGANLNKGPCSCRSEGGDPRFEVLRKLMENQ